MESPTLVLRTLRESANTGRWFGWSGPSEFGQWFLGRWKERMGIPVGDPSRKASIDGYMVNAGGTIVPVASEEDAFRLIGANFVPPERRDAMVEAMAARRGSA